MSSVCIGVPASTAARAMSHPSFTLAALPHTYSPAPALSTTVSVTCARARDQRVRSARAIRACGSAGERTTVLGFGLVLGLGVGLGVAIGLGLGVGLGVAIGLGAGVGRGVAIGVGAGVRPA